MRHGESSKFLSLFLLSFSVLSEKELENYKNTFKKEGTE